MTIQVDNIATYSVRHIPIMGFNDLAHSVDYFFPSTGIRTGVLVAINAEKVITAETDQGLRELIDSAEYKYADGVSIVRAIRRKYPQAIINRVAGADLWEALMQRAGQLGTPVFLVGGKPEILAKTVTKLQEQWQVNIVGSQDGYFSAEMKEEIIERIRASGAALVTVALGSPRQELLINECRKVYPTALYMGVGGTYDVFTGVVKRAPKFWQNLGLEWLYRLLKQPTRWQRQLKLMKFLYYYYTGRL